MTILEFEEKHMRFIKKRNGVEVPFDAKKITKALAKAGEATGEFGQRQAISLCTRVINVLENLYADSVPSVEEVQDVVEEVLLGSSFRKTAKAYIIYRDQHAKMRSITNQMNIDLMDKYLRAEDWRVKENANMGFSLQGLNNYISGELSKAYWTESVYPAEVRKAHDSGEIHIHDLGAMAPYCVGWDLQELLLEGFRGVPGKVAAGPAKHFRAALGQIVNFFYTLQGEAAGAQAFANFDTLLAPFIRYDNLGAKEVKQAMQEFIYNVNVATRVGFQTPFTNITMDMQAPSYLANSHVIIGGKPQAETYGDFQVEMDLLNEAFLDVMAGGDNAGRVFTFPIPTYNITKDLDWDDPRLVKLWEVTAKYGQGYFSNFINSDMNPEDTRSMCCRLRLDNRMLRKRGGGLFAANPLTGSIGVVTINLPRMGFQTECEAEFLERLGETMDIAIKSLSIKRKCVERFTEQGLYPYTQHYLRGIKERNGEFWSNHFSTIGLIGMNEASLNLLGQDIMSEKGAALAATTLNFMRDRLAQAQEDSGCLFNLEATPAEGTSHRLAKADKKACPGIIQAGSGEVPYYSNSTQLPVNATDDVFEALDHQDPLQTLYTGGTVFHTYLGERLPSGEAVKRLLKNIFTNYSLPYLTFSPTFSVCPNHGYISGEEVKCSTCGEETEVYARVVGYLRPVKQMNDGKRAEYNDRKLYRPDAERKLLLKKAA